MAWLVTHTLQALNLEHVSHIYASKSKVKGVIMGMPVDIAVDLPPEVAPQLVRDIIEHAALGHSVEVVGQEARRISELR